MIVIAKRAGNNIAFLLFWEMSSFTVNSNLYTIEEAKAKAERWKKEKRRR